MYLTRLTLDHRSRQARRDLADPYQMHKTLVRAFVRAASDTPPRVLWALEPGAGSWSKPRLLVQSASVPDWSELLAVPSYLNGLPELKEFDAVQLVDAASQFRFRLLANPVTTKDGKRLGIVGERGQLEWLERKSNSCGFKLEAALVTESQLMESTKGEMKIRLQRTAFEGLLTVTDHDRLVHAVVTGIGHGKAFGCGLLMIRRI